MFEERQKELWGDLRILDDTKLPSAPRSHYAGFRLPAERALADDELMHQGIDLLCDLFVALDGFYGKVDTTAMLRRRLDLRSAAADRGTMWIPRWNDPTFVIWDRWVEPRCSTSHWERTLSKRAPEDGATCSWPGPPCCSPARHCSCAGSWWRLRSLQSIGSRQFHCAG